LLTFFDWQVYISLAAPAVFSCVSPDALATAKANAKATADAEAAAKAAAEAKATAEVGGWQEG
jgi:hypothetical protein